MARKGYHVTVQILFDHDRIQAAEKAAAFSLGRSVRKVSVEYMREYVSEMLSVHNTDIVDWDYVDNTRGPVEVIMNKDEIRPEDLPLVQAERISDGALTFPKEE